MKHDQIEAALQLAVELAPLCLHTNNLPRTVLKLARTAQSLHKRFTAECSYQWADTDRYRKMTDSLSDRIVALFDSLNIPPGTASLRINRDPRGWPLVFTINAHEHRLG